MAHGDSGRLEAPGTPTRRKKAMSVKQRRLELEQEVAQLQKMLANEEGVHEVLQRALLPHASRSTLHIPSFLPKKAKELLAELVMVEEEIARLEGEVSRIQQGLRDARETRAQETSKRNRKEHENALAIPPSNGPLVPVTQAPNLQARQEKVALETKPMFFINQAIKGDYIIHGFTNKGNSGSLVQPTDKKGSQRIEERKERISRKSGMIEKSSSPKQPIKHSALKPPDSDAETLSKFLQEPYLTATLLEKNYQKSQPNKLSEKIMKCLICIFLRLIRTSRAMELEKSGNVSRSATSFLRAGSFRADNSMNLKASLFTQRETKRQDPYGIFEMEESLARDTGPYKNLVRFTSSSLDFRGISKSLPLLNQLRVLMKDLQEVDLRFLTHQQKLAFWINMHNICIMHGFLEHRLPSNPEKVLALRSKAVLDIGGNKLNALAIEYSILRQASSMKEGDKDDREAAVRNIYGLEQLEPDIAFALCSGTRSSPAVRIYTADNVIDELEKAKLEYLQASMVVTTKKRLMIPELLILNMHDFARDLDSLVEWICNQLPTSWSLRKSMVECLRSQSNGKISDIVDIMPYDLEFQYLLPM